MVDLDDGADDVEETGQQPEQVVDVVAIVDEGGTVFPEADTVQVQGVISEEVQNESEVAEDAVQNHALRGDLVLGKPVADARNQRDLLAPAENFPCCGHRAFEFVEAGDELVHVGTARLHQWQQSHDGVLDDTAGFVATGTRVNDVNHLLEEEDQGRLGRFFLCLGLHF